MATIQDLGKVAYFNKGAYNSETTYEINDVVSYNGSSYVSLGNGNRGNLPTNATYWSVVASKGDKGDTGKPFVIEKTYQTIEAMVADYDNMNVNDYVMISGNIEEQENATLWTKTETQVSPYKWVYLADFSGASGITGATPNIQIGNVTEGNEPAVTRRAGSTNENPILDFVLKTGAKGDTGATGNGIASVAKTGTSGLTDTYTITYTNTNTSTFDVKNGKGITNIAKTGTSGLVDTYTITYNDGTTSTFEITNGEDGEVTQTQLDETNEQVELANMVYNALPKITGNGESITLDDTVNTPLKLELKGNTSQETTSVSNGDQYDSPSPDHPQDIEVVTGNNTIKVEGKNLCNGINQNVYSNTAVNQCGTNSADSGLYIPVTSNTYTISTKITQARYRVACSKNIPTPVPQTVYRGVNKDGTSNSITIDTTGYDYLIVNATDLTAIQIEKGSTATTYEAYQSASYQVNLGSIELCKIGTYQDRIYKSNGNWYLHKEIHKIILDGSESGWDYDTQYKYFRNPSYNFGNNIPLEMNDANKNTYMQYMNLFKINKAWSGTNSFRDNVSVQGEFYLSQNAGYKVMFRNLNIDNVTDLQAWLSTHNVINYYPLATPTETQITDTTLISQLNAIEKAVSYDTQTNISQENANKPFIITATAVKDLSKILDNLDARLSLVEE